jgi:hypothetical protein
MKVPEDKMKVPVTDFLVGCLSTLSLVTFEFKTDSDFSVESEYFSAEVFFSSSLYL